jgi:hypothetical protein
MWNDSRLNKQKWKVGWRIVRLPAALWLAVAIAVLAGAIAEGCGNGVSPATGSGSLATVSIKLSDPATCMAPNGPFSHVYVTISDVKASVSSTAGDGDSSWVDLTPKLAKAPLQADLLALPADGCFLASLGDSLQIQAGNYQQFRLILTDSTALFAAGANKCTGSANCVVVNGTTSPLLLSSETQTGIKIPSGQIANGGFNIAAGQTKDLDIDFNTCVSIVQEGNGKYRLKPVLHASEVSTTSTSINGTVIDSATGNHITGTATVALEQKDSAGIDRIFMTTVTDASGNFVFCPLPSASYDVVVVGQSAAGTIYSPTVVTGVSTGSAMGSVQMHALPVVSVAAATLSGLVTSQNGSAAGTQADVQLSALEAVSSTVTVPLIPSASQSSAVLVLETASGGTCPSGTDCVSYSVKVSAGPAFVGTSGAAVTQSALPAAYIVDGIASAPSSGGAADCSPGEVMSTSVTPVVSTDTAVPTLKFMGCS